MTTSARIPANPLLLVVLGATLSAAGHLSWWLVPLWFAGFWMMRTSDLARIASAAMPVVLAFTGALSAAPQLGAMILIFAPLLPVAFAVHFGMNLLEDRRVTGLAVLALVWLFAPSALGMAGLLLAAAAFGMLTQRGTRFVALSPHATRALAVFTLVVSAAAWLLPTATGPSVGSALHSLMTTSEVQPPPAAPEDTQESPTNRAGQKGGGGLWQKDAQSLPALSAFTERALTSGPPLVLLLITACIVVLGFLLQRIRVKVRNGLRIHWSEVVVLAAMVIPIVIGVALLYQNGFASQEMHGSAGGSPTGSILPSEEVEGPSDGLEQERQIMARIMFAFSATSVVILCAGLIAVLFMLLRAFRTVRDGDEPNDGPVSDATAGVRETAGHRVRVAYRRMLAALSVAGEGRRANETPVEVARRVSQRYPVLRQDLQLLTSLYLPVRYGRELDERDAQRAERSAARIEQHLGAPTRAEES